MGNLSASIKVANQAALANADKVDGGFLPPATTVGTLGSQSAMTHDRAIYDQGLARIITNAPGGTLIVYHGTIVPSDKRPGQITEDEFLKVLATELSRRIIGIGQGDGPDPEFVAISRGMLDRFFAVLIPPGARMERVLRAALNLPADLTSRLTVNTFVYLLLEKIEPLICNLDSILKFANELDRMEAAKNGDDFEQAAQQLFSMAGIMWFRQLEEIRKSSSLRKSV